MSRSMHRWSLKEKCAAAISLKGCPLHLMVIRGSAMFFPPTFYFLLSSAISVIMAFPLSLSVIVPQACFWRCFVLSDLVSPNMCLHGGRLREPRGSVFGLWSVS